MKAQIKIEAVGDNTHQWFRLWTGILDSGAPGLGETVLGKIPRRYWVARITGHHPQYKYEREFLRGKKDYTHANSKGSRGVFVYYLLESGLVYEVKKRSDRFFCIVNDDGDIIKVTKGYVEQWISDHSGLACLLPLNGE